MNARERKQIGKLSERVSDELVALVQEIQEVIQEFVDNEQEKIDNMPENLYGSEKANRMEEYIDALEGAYSDLDFVWEFLKDAKEGYVDIYENLYEEEYAVFTDCAVWIENKPKDA